MATASAVTNTFSSPGVLMSENFADILDARFKDVALRAWNTPVEGLKYFAQQNTNRAYEKYSAVMPLGVVPKSTDVDEIPMLNSAQGFDMTITPVVYKAGVRVEKRLRETDQVGVIDKLFGSLMQAWHETQELYAALPFNTAFSTTVEWICADGMNLIDASRRYEDNTVGTWDNEETAAALSQSSIATMRLNFDKNKNERGRLAPIKMEKLVVNSTLQDTAITQLMSVLKPGSSLNDKNYLTQYGISYEVWRYLSSTTPYFGFGPKDSLFELYWLWGAPVSVMDYDSGNPDVYAKRLRAVFATGCRRPHSVRGNAGA